MAQDWQGETTNKALLPGMDQAEGGSFTYLSTSLLNYAGSSSAAATFSVLLQLIARDIY